MRWKVWSALAAVCAIPECAIVSAQTSDAKPQFEVASVKAATAANPSPGLPMMREMMRASRKPGMIPMEDAGRIRLQDWALLDLIAAAYSVRASQISGPAWISDQAFTVEAKLPEGTKKEQLNAMLQSLLEERFGLKVHRDTQTKQGYALLVGKNGPKLEPAQPPAAEDPDLTPEQRRAKQQEQAMKNMDAMKKRMQENRESDTPIQGLSRVRFGTITSEGLATQLARLAEAPVIDETGLTGNYSISLETWKNADVPGGTVFDAVLKLGLKLEPRKISVERVVIDQVSRTPTAN